MDISHLADNLKIVGPIVSALIYYLQSRNAFQPLGRRRSKENESLEFISSFLAFDLEKRNRLVVEHAFEIYLRKRLSYDEIRALLRFNNPLTSIRLFIKARQHIKYNSTTGKFEYAAHTATPMKRGIHKTINIFGYFTFSMTGMALFFYFPEITTHAKPEVYFPIFFIIFLFLFLSYMFLQADTSISAAEKFMSEKND